MEENKITPKYEFAVEDGAELIAPIRRKINKTMEITESFTYYDALAYCMKMEKAVQDKQAEIDGINSMIKAYRDEIEIIEKQLAVTEIEEKWNKDLQKKLQEEALDKKINDAANGDEIVSPYNDKKEE
jgi:hypothetical protein